ncbi:hypothetical protein JEG42_07475, partial [Anoxybacillus sp. LAT_11]|nr:hypothetical protein [Anoxybacillus sp. LAT_11]
PKPMLLAKPPQVMPPLVAHMSRHVVAVRAERIQDHRRRDTRDATNRGGAQKEVPIPIMVDSRVKVADLVMERFSIHA